MVLLPVGKTQFVVAEMEDIAFIYSLVVYAHAFVVDAVGTAEVLNIVRTVTTNNRRMLSRDISILDRQVARFGTPPDDELVFVDRNALIVEDQL